MRKYFIDNLRWISILLLFPYHASMIYNDFGEDFYIRGENVGLLGGFIKVCYLWYMPLLFALAGISAFYALEKKLPKEYLKERFYKLFIPFIAGIILLVPIQTYFAERFHNGYDGSYFAQYKLFFGKITDLNGYTGGFTPAQLWFLLYLFIISIVTLPFILKYKKCKYKIQVSKISMTNLLSLFIIFWLMSFVSIGGKSFGGFLALFLFGYFVLSKENIQLKLDKNRWILFIWLIILTIISLLCLNIWNISSGILYSIFSAFTTCIGVLAIFGMGKHYLEFKNRVTGYFSKAGFPIYILHQSVLILVAYYVFNITSIVIVQFITIIIMSFIMTMFFYELFKRIAITRFLFGIKK